MQPFIVVFSELIILPLSTGEVCVEGWGGGEKKDVGLKLLSSSLPLRSSPDGQAAENPFPFGEPDERHRDGDR